MDIKTELMLEGLNLQVETMTAAILTLNAANRQLAEALGIDVTKPTLTEKEEEQRKMLLSSVAKRLVNLAVLAAKADGVEIDRETVGKNVVKVLTQAAATKGESITNDTLANDIFEGAFPDEDMDDVEAYSLDAPVADPKPDEKMPMSMMLRRADPDIVNEEFDTEGTDEGHATDADLLGVFRSARKKKAEDPYVEFEGGVIRANFYSPETLPMDPEEFIDYDKKAIEYFKGLLKKAQRAKLIDDDTAHNVIVVFHGGVNFDMAKISTEDGMITQTILDQGHSQPYFEVSTTNTVEVAEALIAAYSVSVARLRGSYMQAKLQELQEYIEASQD